MIHNYFQEASKECFNILDRTNLFNETKIAVDNPDDIMVQFQGLESMVTDLFQTKLRILDIHGTKTHENQTPLARLRQ